MAQSISNPGVSYSSVTDQAQINFGSSGARSGAIEEGERTTGSDPIEVVIKSTELTRTEVCWWFIRLLIISGVILLIAFWVIGFCFRELDRVARSTVDYTVATINNLNKTVNFTGIGHIGRSADEE